MKKMKLFCGILIGFMILSSCSNDNDNDTDSKSIVGIWKPIKEVTICSTGNEETFDFSTCLQMTRATFNSNGTLNNMEYSDDTGSCVENFGNGTWSLIGNNLTITLNGETNNPTFLELTNNTLKIGYYNNNSTCDGENLTSHSFTEYIRIEK